MTEPITPKYDATQDPIAETVLKVFMTPMWDMFGQARPDSNEVERKAANAIVYTYGLTMILLARLATRLDMVKAEPSGLGGFLGEFTFVPNPETDTPEARLDVAQRIEKLGHVVDEALAPAPTPPEDTRPMPGMYL